jgi:HAD superfamily hydrolase (TIGR01509 family)
MPHCSCDLVIFDMDGTLTEPILDFDLIRTEIGIPSGTILEALAQMTPTARQRAMEIVEHHERKAASRSTLNRGVSEVLSCLRQHDIRTAVATRNSKNSTDTVLGRHQLTFDCIDTREDGLAKPAPDPMLRICGRLSVRPERAWVVGDYLYDLQSGRQAGTTTVLLLAEGGHCTYSDVADHVICDLRMLPRLIGCQLLEEGR